MQALAMAGVAAMCRPMSGLAAAFPQATAMDLPLTGDLSIFNVNTRESLKVHYLDTAGIMLPEAQASLNTLFRCKMTDRVATIAPELFMLLDALRTSLGVGDKPLELICGYRSPEYNSMRAEVNPGVSKNSYHVKGMAADVAVEGVPVSRIRTAAVDLALGGVGAYSEFVHVDVGPVRTW